MCSRPVRHGEHVRQAMCVSAATNAPGATWWTSSPTASTVPATSWPNVIGTRPIRCSAHSFQS